MEKAREPQWSQKISQRPKSTSQRPDIWLLWSEISVRCTLAAVRCSAAAFFINIDSRKQTNYEEKNWNMCQ